MDAAVGSCPEKNEAAEPTPERPQVPRTTTVNPPKVRGASGREVALVTGGATRVGRAVALGLADAGYDIAISYWSSKAGAAEVGARAEALGRRCLAVEADLSRAGGPAKVAEAVASEFGGLSLVVNSASSFVAADLLAVTRKEWDDVMAVNLRAPFLLVRDAAALLRRARGSVVNIVDLSAFQAWAAYPHHSVSKAGLLHLTKVMAVALAPEVRVNAVAPGHVLDPADARPAEPEAGPRAALLDRSGQPEDVVQAVLYLARAPFVTGEVMVCDGGRLLRTQRSR